MSDMAIMLLAPKPIEISRTTRAPKQLRRMIALPALMIACAAGSHVALASHAAATRVPSNHAAATTSLVSPGPLPSAVVLNGVAQAIASR